MAGGFREFGIYAEASNVGALHGANFRIDIFFVLFLLGVYHTASPVVGRLGAL